MQLYRTIPRDALAKLLHQGNVSITASASFATRSASICWRAASSVGGPLPVKQPVHLLMKRDALGRVPPALEPLGIDALRLGRIASRGHEGRQILRQTGLKAPS